MNPPQKVGARSPVPGFRINGCESPFPGQCRAPLLNASVHRRECEGGAWRKYTARRFPIQVLTLPPCHGALPQEQTRRGPWHEPAQRALCSTLRAHHLHWRSNMLKWAYAPVGCTYRSHLPGAPAARDPDVSAQRRLHGYLLLPIPLAHGFHRWPLDLPRPLVGRVPLHFQAVPSVARSLFVGL